MSRINVSFFCEDGTDSDVFVTDFSSALRHRLERRDFILNCVTSNTPFEFDNTLPAPDLICTRLKDIEPVESIGPLVHRLGSTPILLMIDPGELSKAFQAVQFGAWDFVTLPVDAERISTLAGAFIRLHGARLRRSREIANENATPDVEAVNALLSANRLAAVELPEAVLKKRASERARPVCRPFWQQEQDIIENALRIFDGNISRAAAALEISPSTIYRKRQAWNERDVTT